MRKGADAYIAKPFNKEALIARMEQLIQSRIQLQELFGRNSPSDGKPEGSQRQQAKFKLEQQFIAKIREIVHQNLENENFDSQFLAREMAMSASQLYRKLKAVTGKSTALYIRLVRLQKAQKLLQTTDDSVSQIALQVGFKELAYFSRCFSEEFGVSPSQFRK